LQAWDHDARPPPGWTVDAPARLDAWRALFAEEGPDTLLVTSNGAARFALLAHSTLRPAGSLKLRTGAFATVERGDGPPVLASWDVRP